MGPSVTAITLPKPGAPRLRDSPCAGLPRWY